MIEKIRRLLTGRRKTRYCWPQYTTHTDIPQDFYPFYMDDEPRRFRVAILNRDFRLATRIYKQAENGLRDSIQDAIVCDRYLDLAIDAYRESDRQNPVACVTYESSMVARAWFAKYAEGDDAPDFERVLAETLTAIDSAQAHAPGDANTWKNALTVGMISDLAKDKARTIWEMGCRADNMSLYLHCEYLGLAFPRRGGSLDYMDAVVDAVMKIRPGSYLNGIVAYAFEEKTRCESREDPLVNAVIDDIDCQNQLINAYTTMRKGCDTLAEVEVLNYFAYGFWFIGNNRWSLDVMRTLKHRYIYGPWSDKAVFDDGPFGLAAQLQYLLDAEADGTLD